MECNVLRDEMLGVLYGESDAATAARVEQHLAVCGACRDELAAFRRVRRDLEAWARPALARTRWTRPSGPWRGLAAAAALLLAAAGALTWSGAELQVGSGGVRLRLGRPDAELRQALSEQDARHRRELAELRQALAAPAARDDAALLARVQDLIRESEARQAVLLQASLADLGERTEAQRRYDLARVSTGLSYLEGRTGEQVARTTELMGYLLQASQQR